MESGRLKYEKQERYGPGVLIGTWFEKQCEYVKNPHDFKSLYSIEYAPKPRSANDPALVWNQMIRAQGYGARLIFDHQAPHYLDNMSTTYDLSYRIIPSQFPNGPIHRDFRSRLLRFEPQQDYAENYGNVTKYGLVDSFKEKWRCEVSDPRLTLTSHYRDTFIAPKRHEYESKHVALPIPNSSYMANRLTANLKLRGKPVNSVPEQKLVVIPQLERCNPITWECPDQYKSAPDRCVENKPCCKF